MYLIEKIIICQTFSSFGHSKTTGPPHHSSRTAKFGSYLGFFDEAITISGVAI